MNSDKLKPCPFCGSEATVLTMPGTYMGTTEYLIRCKKCSACTGLWVNELNARKAWNRRTK